MEPYEIAEWIEANWPSCTKHKPLVHSSADKMHSVRLYLRIPGELWVVVQIDVGRRRGVTVYFWAYDPSQVILADRIVNYGEPFSLTEIVDVLALRESVKAADPVGPCVEALESLCTAAHDDPATWDRLFRSVEVSSRSAYAFSGALPGTSRRARGGHR